MSLDYSNPISNTVNSFLMDNNLYRCDVLFPVSSKFTYVNESLNSMSCIDYLVSSSLESMIAYNVLDLDINFSYHLPIIAVFECALPATPTNLPPVRLFQMGSCSYTSLL